MPGKRLLPRLSRSLAGSRIYSPLVGSLLLIIVSLLPSLMIAPAAIALSTFEQLSRTEQTALREGQVIINGKNGTYTSKVLISAPLPVVWSVLTDYNRLPRFLPGIISSRVLEARGNQKVVEQIDSRKIMVLQIRSRLRSVVTEAYAQRRIDFQLVEGDLQQLQGYWQLEPTTTTSQILLTQQITAQPKNTVPKTVFYDVFRTSLKQNFNAIRAEAERRVNEYSLRHRP